MPSQSLIDFFQKEVAHRLPKSKQLRILELGSGAQSLFEALPEFSNVEITAIDKDPDIKFKTSRPNIKFIKADMTAADFGNLFHSSFDLIIDAHCFHCVTDSAARVRAFINVKQLLGPRGFFAAEMMIQSKQQRLEVIQRFVPTNLELEQEILKNKLKIIFFVVSRDLVFELNVEQGLECDLVRVIATK